MSIEEKKNKILNKVSATRTLGEDKFDNAKQKRDEALASINNAKGKIISFLTDLITILVGFSLLIDTIVNTLTNYLQKIEVYVKKGLKRELKSIVSCGIDPSLPDFLKSTSTKGIVIEVKKVDFFDLFKTDPNSVAGKLMYKDITSPLTNSSDFNTFLYGVIQDDGTTYSWRGILDITFVSKNTDVTIPNNSLIIKANKNYDSKKLTKLNNDFINTLTLFNSQGIINRLIDTIYGSISFSVGKSKKQLESEGKLNALIDKMIDLDANDTIDDTFFTFTNDETSEIQMKADLLEKGVAKIDTSQEFNASIPISMLSDLNNQMTQPNLTDFDKKQIIANNLSKMANQLTANNLPPIPKLPKIPSIPPIPSLDNLPDNVTIKLSFTDGLFSNITKCIISSVISPKVILIFLINLKIIYGPDANYKDGVDFIKKNKNIFREIIRGISTMIIKLLMAIAMREITNLVVKAIVKKRVEKYKNQAKQMLSLIIPNTDVIDDIAN